MKGFGLLLMLAAVAVMLTCDPPGVLNAGENDICMDQTASLDQIDTADEFPGNNPAEHQGVLDPGSCVGTEVAAVEITSEYGLACRGRAVRRAGSRIFRLLSFPLRC